MHSGQVSLPGGRSEEGDCNIAATALREANEEVGVDAQSVSVLGALTPLLSLSVIILSHPSLAGASNAPTLPPTPAKSPNCSKSQIHALCDPQNHIVESWQLRDRTADVPFTGSMDNKCGALQRSYPERVFVIASLG